jgi:glucuronosyltransferase
MNEAKEGVVYCSLGSLIQFETISKDRMEALTSLFSGIPQRIIWKIDPTVELPDNVMAKKWYPQFEILSE